MPQADRLTLEESLVIAEADTEEVACSLCGSWRTSVIGEGDRNGSPTCPVICTHCGLIFLSPRMKASWYGQYYGTKYRAPTVVGNPAEPVPPDLEAAFRQQQLHGEYLAQYLTWAGVPRPRRILEIGSGPGGLLQTLAEAFGAQVLGLDPCIEAAQFAERQGILTCIGLLDEVDLLEGQNFDLVVAAQGFDRLLDPRGVAERVCRLLSPGGFFLVECQNYFHACRYWGERIQAPAIERTHMFAPVTLQALLAVSGFEIQSYATQIDEHSSARRLRRKRRAGLPSFQMRLLARPSPHGAQPAPRFYPAVKDELDRLPHAPLACQLFRRWERQLMKVDDLLDHVRGAVRRVGSALGFYRPAA